VRRGRDARINIGRIVQTRSLPPQHLTAIQGFPVTTVARTFFDLCGDPDPGLRRRGGHPVHDRKMARVYNDAAGRRGLTFVQELAVLAAMAKRGRRGTRLVRRLLLRFGPRYVPTRSDAETFLWRAERVIAEVDSRWHDGPLDQERDEARDRRAEAAGYVVRRYRYRDLIGQPTQVHRELVVAMRRLTA
jgi:very-short-patch-repair endonuclease